MMCPEYSLEETNPISLANLRMMDAARFRELIGKAFKRLGYSVWLSERFQPEADSPPQAGQAPLTEINETRYSVLLKNEERALIQCSQGKGLVDISLIKDFCQDLKKERIESGFFVTTGMITLLDRTYLCDKPIDCIGAKELLPFLKTIFGEISLRKEIKQIFERRKSPRLDLQRLKEKILWQVNTLYGTPLQVKGAITNIGCGGIGFESVEKILICILKIRVKPLYLAKFSIAINALTNKF